MKILFICKSLPPKVTGGIQTHTWKLSGWLSKLGHEVTILHGGSLRAGERYAFGDGRILIQIPYFPGRRLPFLSDLAEEWAFNRAVLTWLKKNKGVYDVIHVQGRSGFTLPDQISGTPVITTFHGLMSIENHRSGQTGRSTWSQRLHERWTTRHEKRALVHSDAVVAVSEEMLAGLKALEPDAAGRVVIIPNGVDRLPDQLPAFETDPKLMLFVGRLHRIKGIYSLVEAMNHTHTDFNLVVVGDGPERRALEAVIVASGLENRIKLTGALNQEAVFQWIHRAGVLILPSFHESQGIVILEAFSAGKPVIASDLPAIRDVVQHGDNGLLFEAGASEQLAICMDWMIEHPAEASEMGRRGQVLAVEQFDWEKIAMDTERLYGKVLATKNQEKIQHIVRKHSVGHTI